MKKKLVQFVVLLLVLVPFFSPLGSNADEAEKSKDGVISQPIPSNDVELYTRYKDNNFQLITKEAESLTGLKASIQNVTGSVKEVVWSGVMNTGKFNTSMVRYLFGYDLDTIIKTPILNLTASLATGMLSIASSLGILAVMIIMVLKYIGEGSLKNVLRTFGMTILIFACLVLLSNSNRNNTIASTVVDADSLVESTFVSAIPIFSETKESTPKAEGTTINEELQNSGDAVSAKVFRTNVYEPYLLFTYGTSNEETIRQKKVEYKGTEYDRIGILLDNDTDSKDGEKIFESVTTYEAEDLKNKTISWKNNLSLAGQGVFYLLLNIIQSVVYFVLCILRLILILLRWLLFPLMPILLLFGLFNSQINVFKNGGKAFVSVIGFKAMVAFAMVFFASYMSLGYSMASEIDDPYTKIVTILIYLITPLGLYFFRSIIGKMITGQMTLSDFGGVIRNPYRTARTMNRASRQQAKMAREKRKQMKEDYKNRKENPDGKKETPKYNLPRPNSSQQPRSERRSENEAPNTNPSNQPTTDKDGELKENVGQMRRYKKEKPVKAPEPKEPKQRLSQLRKERSPERQQREPSRTSQKFNKAHENSRYQDTIDKRNQPERQRIKRQAQERVAQRQQEQMRVVAMGRSPRRAGQATQAVSGEFQKHAGNIHKQSGQTYQPKQTVTQPRGKWRNNGNTKTQAPMRRQQQSTSKTPVVHEKKGTMTRKIVSHEAPKKVAKGVKRRRV